MQFGFKYSISWLTVFGFDFEIWVCSAFGVSNCPFGFLVFQLSVCSAKLCFRLGNLNPNLDFSKTYFKKGFSFNLLVNPPLRGARGVVTLNPKSFIFGSGGRAKFKSRWRSSVT